MSPIDSGHPESTLVPAHESEAHEPDPDPSEHGSEPGSGVRAFLWGAALVLALAVLAAEILGATRFRHSWWGVHAYGFLPPWCLVVGAGLVVAGLVVAWRLPGLLERAFATCASFVSARPAWMVLTPLTLIAVSLFWFFREAHTFLGDGNPLVTNLTRGQSFHIDEPLTLYLHHSWYLVTRGLFAAPGRSAIDVAHATVGLSSALCGAVFVPVAWFLARGLLGFAPPAADDDRPGRAATAALVFAVVLAQGYVQLLFGYVENYSFYLAALACYCLAAVRSITRRDSLILPAAFLILALALHLSAFVLLPSFGVLVLRDLADRSFRRRALRDLLVGAGLFVATDSVLGRISPGYSWSSMVLRLTGSATTSTSSYGFNPPNLGQFLNQQVLIGPLGIFLLAACVAGILLLRAWRNVPFAFLVALAIGYVVASCIAGDSNLGVARNWDLLAPAGFVFAFVAIALAVQVPWRGPDLRRWLFVLALISLFHTVPWVAVNASFDRGFERFKALPLGRGRTQMTVGNWYLSQGREREAADWYQRSLDENPHNNVAAFQLGRIAMRYGEYPLAQRAFSIAVRVRPHVERYRFALVDACVRSGRLAAARAEMDTLLVEHPREPLYWAASSFVWIGLSRPDSARAALGVAKRLAPGFESLPELERELGREDAARYFLQTLWPQIMQY